MLPEVRKRDPAEEVRKRDPAEVRKRDPDDVEKEAGAANTPDVATPRRHPDDETADIGGYVFQESVDEEFLQQPPFGHETTDLGNPEGIYQEASPETQKRIADVIDSIVEEYPDKFTQKVIRDAGIALSVKLKKPIRITTGIFARRNPNLIGIDLSMFPSSANVFQDLAEHLPEITRFADSGAKKKVSNPDSTYVINIEDDKEFAHALVKQLKEYTVSRKIDIAAEVHAPTNNVTEAPSPDEDKNPESLAELEQRVAQKIEAAVWEILSDTQAEPRSLTRLAGYIENFIANPGFSLTDNQGKRNSDLDEPYMRLRNSLGELFLKQEDGLVIPEASSKQTELSLLAIELRIPATLERQINRAVTASISEQNADSSVVNSLIRGLENFLVDPESPSLTRDNQAELTLLTDVAEKFPELMPIRGDGLPVMEITTPKQRAIVRFVISALRDKQNAVTAESGTLDNTVTNQETASPEQVELTNEVKENIDRVVENRYGSANLLAMNNPIGLLEVLVPFVESGQVADENKDYTEEKEELQNLAEELSDYFDNRSEIPALYPNHNTLYKYLLARIAKTEIFNPLKEESRPLVEYIDVSEIQDKLQEWIEELG